MPDKVPPDDVDADEDEEQDTSISCVVISLAPLQLTLERLVHMVGRLVLAALLVALAVLVASL